MSASGRGGWFEGKAPTDLGVRDERLKPCPDTPNCVSSQAQGAARVAPLACADPPAAAMARLKQALRTLPRMTVVAEGSLYLRAEARSRLFGFVDDVEFLLDPQAGLIHVRSASRIGYSDLGANRKRVEAIRAALAASPAPE